mmetsp:Transcript_120806/g.301440  ORF Transcript_120806/g.301440 Transcript_120806/m.301440 type:complete len:229 (-) Transcript_120806:517-1203(-)
MATKPIESRASAATCIHVFLLRAYCSIPSNRLQHTTPCSPDCISSQRKLCTFSTKLPKPSKNVCETAAMKTISVQVCASPTKYKSFTVMQRPNRIPRWIRKSSACPNCAQAQAWCMIARTVLVAQTLLSVALASARNASSEHASRTIHLATLVCTLRGLADRRQRHESSRHRCFSKRLRSGTADARAVLLWSRSAAAPSSPMSSSTSSRASSSRALVTLATTSTVRNS